MTDEEQIRFTRLETSFNLHKIETEKQLLEINKKLDTLVTAFNMGRGGAVTAAKIGGLILAVSGMFAFLIDHILAVFK